MKSLIRIVLAGSGGQGLGLAGKILAEAAIHGGKNAAHSQSYGARARGGSSSSAVTIGSGEIVYPLVERPDILVTLTQESYDINRPLLAAGGMVLYDRDSVTAEGGPDEHGELITSRAREIKNEKGTSLLALGVLVGMTGLVEPADVGAAIDKNFSGAAVEVNRQAFLEGIALVMKKEAKSLPSR